MPHVTANRFASSKSLFPGSLLLWVHEHLLTAVAHNHLPSDIQSQLAASPLIASAVALLWTGALLAVVLCVTLGRCSEQSDAERGRAAVETLRQAENLVRTRDAVIFGLAKLADSRDPETGDHLERISAYSALLASLPRRRRGAFPVLAGRLRTGPAGGQSGGRAEPGGRPRAAPVRKGD